MMWMLILSIIPMVMVSWLGYRNAVETIDQMERNRLENTADINIRFINDWFEQTHKNLESWSQFSPSQHMLATLATKWKQSGKTLQEFVGSAQYQELLPLHDDHLVRISENYTYVYDLFLIDLQGNILYTVAKEADLGTNLLNGAYATTRFAHAYRETLRDHQAHFSDLEHYSPSGGIIAGFMCVPMRNDSGTIVGVMALQIQLQSIFGQFEKSNLYSDGLKHYLVGNDGLLRTKLVSKEDVLSRKITTKQFWKWYNEHGLNGLYSQDMEEYAFVYEGPSGKKVLGKHQSINILGVRYAHISEIDEEKILEKPHAIAVKTLVLLLAMIGTVILVALLLARRITRPIHTLMEGSMEYMRGVKGVRVQLNSSNEIGEFGEVFNTLMETQEENEARLSSLTREAEKALEELQEQKFALDSHSIVAITDVKGRITFANAKFEEISGYTSSELIGKNHRLLKSEVHSREFWKKMYETVSRGGAWNAEVCNIAKDGHPYWVDTTIVPFKDDKGKPQSYVAIRTDITERKKIEAELIQAKEAAEASEHTKSEFLAIMSHEIRTPMNGVLGMLGLLERSKLDRTQQHQLIVAKNSATSLLVIINDILDFSKIEAGKMELEAVEINLHSTLKELLESFSFKAHEKGLELFLEESAIAHPNIIIDSGRLRQILTNLIGNALKFTHDGSITIKASLQSVAQTGRLHIDIIDTGIGIPQEKIATLFDPFTQADGSTTRKYGGTGLGLSIVKRLCELMGGTIEIESTLGEGSSFHIEMVVGLGSEEMQSKPVAVEPIDRDEEIQWPIQTRILLVEDNSTNQMVAIGMLDAIGLEADIATNGAEAIEALRLALNTLPYTLVLMDGQMPVMDGYEATHRIRAGEAGDENCTVIIVAMTANAMAGDREKCMIAGMDDFITKPVDLTILKKTLLKYLLPHHGEQSGKVHAENPKEEIERENFSTPSLWDYKEALTRMGENEALLDKVIHSFIEEVPQIMNSLKESVARGDFAEAQLPAHSLQGLSANIGATALHSIGKRIESAAKEENGILAEKELHVCERILNETLEVLGEYILQNRAPTIKPRRLDPLDIAIKLHKLRQDLEKGLFVDTEALGIFSEYADSRISVLMYEIKENIDKVEYTKALETIKRIMEILE